MSSKILAGRYELFEKIGEGGMSVVYKAKDRLLNRFVAIKILKPEFVKDNKFIESFRRESQSAASLAHPNIVNIFDVGQEGNIHYIVMELVEGETLSDLIHETGPLPYQRTIEITKQVASALSVAHENHIIHRDVKPHNVLITQNGTAKITDFGIAKAMNSATIVDSTTGGGVIGSVHYFSPEQARGGYVDEKSDIYSLGIVMYEMLTGRVPFDGDNPVNIALMHINSQMVQPSKLISGIPPALEQIVLKATDKIQTNRFSSAQELIDALDNLQFVGSVVGTSVFMGQGAADDLADPDKPMVETGFDDGEDDDFEDDDGNEKEKKPKKKMSKKQKMTIAAIVAAILVAGIAFAAVSGLLGGKVEVPELVDETYSQAKKIAKEAGFEIEKGGSEYNPDVKKGRVASQDPEAGGEAKKGSTITVIISKGPDEADVPNVIGKNKEDAEQTLEDAGFTANPKTQPSDKPKDQVFDQDPQGKAPTGSTITIYVSDGSRQKVDVPYLLGLDYDEAVDKIEKAGLTPGKPTYKNSDTYAKNKVMDQGVKAGTQVERGATIPLTVSKGQLEEGIVNYTVDFSRARNEVFFLTVIVSDETGASSHIISNQQRLRSSGSERVPLPGKGIGRVTVLFDGKTMESKRVDFTTGKIG